VFLHPLEIFVLLFLFILRCHIIMLYLCVFANIPHWANYSYHFHTRIINNLVQGYYSGIRANDISILWLHQSTFLSQKIKFQNLFGRKRGQHISVSDLKLSEHNFPNKLGIWIPLGKIPNFKKKRAKMESCNSSYHHFNFGSFSGFFQKKTAQFIVRGNSGKEMRFCEYICHSSSL